MSATVLLVDDDRAALYALSEALSDLPAQFVLAGSGEDALRHVLKQQPRTESGDYLRKPLALELVRARIAALIAPPALAVLSELRASASTAG